MRFAFSFLFSFALPNLACAATTEAIVHDCRDGDTCRVSVRQGDTKLWFNVRLFGIDAPEVGSHGKQGQPLGPEARDALNSKIRGQKVKITQADLDPYNRPIVEIEYQQQNINRWLVQEGFAEVYRGASKRLSRADYFEDEARARKEKRGVWSLEHYLSPGDFRKLQK